MKILSLDRDKAKLQFSIDELLILKNSLLEVYERFTVHEFTALIQGISNEDSVKLATLIENIINPIQKKYVSLPQNNFVLSTKLIEKSYIIQLSYESLLGLRGVLNVLINNVCVIDDFFLKIGFDRPQVSLLLDSIHFDVVEKMQKNRPEFVIHTRIMEISNKLNLKHYNLKVNSSRPRFTQECQLKVGDYIFCFLLVSLKNRREFSGIQTSVKKLSNGSISMESKPQSIRNFDLIRLVSYLELVVESVITDEDLLNYSFAALDSIKKSIFDVQVVSRCMKYSNKESLNIRVKVYNTNQENEISEQYLEAKDSLDSDKINSFVQSIKIFLSKLPENY